MTEEIYKICMVCRVVYEGDITKYNQDSVVERGVCPKMECKKTYLLHTLGCSEETAESMLEEIITKK